MSTPITEDIKKNTDWRINLLDIRQSVVFPGPKQVSEELSRHAQRLADAIERHIQSGVNPESFLLEVTGFRYRAQRLRENLYALRTLRNKPLRLSELGLAREHVDLLLSSNLQQTGGLVIVFGTTGSGKTTTVAATVISRLEELGGYCLCVEDPPENRLEGFYGNGGYAEQIDASGIGYKAALIAALRCFPANKPSMLMMGEIRSAEDAYELMQIALDGHLVITTMHAKDIVSGLSRLVSLAGATGEKDVRAMLASGLNLVMHQTLADYSPKLSVLKFNQTASAIVHHGVLAHLQDEILRQNRKF